MLSDWVTTSRVLSTCALVVVDRALQSLPAVEGAMFIILPRKLSGPLPDIERRSARSTIPRGRAAL
jgi:hypothetical protein